MSINLKLEASWEEVKEKLKESNPNLTNEDLVYAPGNEEQLLQNLSIKMKRSIQEVQGWIESVSFSKGKAS